MPLSASQLGSLESRGFEVHEKLSEGGQGEVFRAVKKDGTADDVVALKVVPKAKIRSDADVFAIKQEVKILRQLDHAHVVGFVDAFTDAEGAYIAIEYLAGMDLYEVMRKGTRFNEKHALLVMRQVVDALAYLHERGISHCDIKLENVVCTDAISASRVKVIDFGIAHVRKPGPEDKPGVHMLGASKEYLSPELVVSHRNIVPEPVDIWCAGVLFYVLLARRFPFNTSGMTKAERGKKILECNLEFPDAQFSSVSVSTKAIIAEMLRRDPEDRPTAAEVLFRIDACLIKLNPEFSGSAKQIPHSSSLLQLPRGTTSPGNESAAAKSSSAALTRKLLSRFDSAVDLKDIASKASNAASASSPKSAAQRSSSGTAQSSSQGGGEKRLSAILSRSGFFKTEDQDQKLKSPRHSRVNLRADIVDAAGSRSDRERSKDRNSSTGSGRPSRSNSGSVSRRFQGLSHQKSEDESGETSLSRSGESDRSGTGKNQTKWIRKLFDRNKRRAYGGDRREDNGNSSGSLRSNGGASLRNANVTPSKERPPVS